MTFVKKLNESDDDVEDKKDTLQSEKQKPTDNRPYNKVKHIFEIKIKELKNIPILDKLIKDISRNELASNTTYNDRSTSKSKKDN